MKFCFPTESGEGLDAKVSLHFGSAPYFTFVDTDRNLVDVVGNENSHNHGHHGGPGDPVYTVSMNGAGAVVVKGMGQGALSRLTQEGIEVYLGEGDTVREMVARLTEGGLSRFTQEQAHVGGHHSHHHH